MFLQNQLFMVLRNGSQGNRDIREVVWINHSIQHQLTDGMFALFIAGREKTSTYSYVFLGGGMPTVRPWRIRTKTAAEALKTCIYYPAGQVESFQLCRIYFTYTTWRPSGWLGKHSTSRSVGTIQFFFFLDYILNQSTAFGCKNAHSWHRCTKSAVAMCRSISQNTCQSWQGRKVEKRLLHPEKPPEFFSVLINVKTPLSSEFKKKNKMLLLSLQHPCKFPWQHLGFLLLPVFLHSLQGEPAAVAATSDKKKKRITYCDREGLKTTFAIISIRDVPILYFNLRSKTNISALNIDWYWYQSACNTWWILAFLFCSLKCYKGLCEVIR